LGLKRNKYKVFIFILFFLLSFLRVYGEEKKGLISISDVQILNLAKSFIDQHELALAKDLLSKKSFVIRELEVERLFLLGKIFFYEKDYDSAIDIFQFILETEPQAAKVRFELALAYIEKESWYSADYHLRLSATEKDLPQSVHQNIDRLLYIIRQNKNWNLGVNIGFAPDRNINNTSNINEECVSTIYGILCRKLPSAEKEIGFNSSIFADYEFRFDEYFRFKNNIYLSNTKYNNKKYDSTFLSLSTGPKFIYSDGDMYFPFVFTRRWSNHKPYNYGVGLQFDTNYDFNQKASANLTVGFTYNFHDKYRELNGFTKFINTSLSYNINSITNINFKIGKEYEDTKVKEYINGNKNFSFGIGSELLYGFSVYVEPSVNIQQYKYSNIFVKNFQFQELIEHNITQKYLMSITNRKFHLYGFSPTFRYWYIKRNSNINQNIYHKHLFDITITRRL